MGDHVDKKTADKLFQAISKVAKAFFAGQYDKKDANFFYDFIGLIGTMQNQHFFSTKQNKTMLGFMSQAAGEAAGHANISEAPPPAPQVSAKESKEIARLEAENKRFQEEIAKLKAVSGAIQVIQTWSMPSLDAEGDKPKKKSRNSRKSKRAKKAAEGGEEDAAGDD